MYRCDSEVQMRLRIPAARNRCLSRQHDSCEEASKEVARMTRLPVLGGTPRGTKGETGTSPREIPHDKLKIVYISRAHDLYLQKDTARPSSYHR